MRKKKNLLFSWMVLLCTFCFSTITMAQPGKHPPHRDGQMFRALDQLKSELKLTEDQVAKLEVLKEEIKSERKALREQEFESPEARRDAVKTFMESTKTQIDEILTEEQRTLLEEKKKVHRERMRSAWEKVDKEGLHDAMKAYHDENIKPVMLAQRAKLEDVLSTEDKTTLAELRTQLGDNLPGPRQIRKHHRLHEKGEHERPEVSEEKKAARTTLKALTEKYSEDIESLLEELAPKHEEWKKEMREIAKEYLPEHPKGEWEGGKKRMKKHKRSTHQHQSERKGKRSGFHKARFLLLDPNAENVPTSIIDSGLEMSIYPNPSTTMNTLTYKVPGQGKVRIELRRENGTLVEVLADREQEAGEYQMDINTANLNDGSYYVTIMTADGKVSTQKMIVSK